MNKNQNRQNVVGFTGETKIFNKTKPSTLVIRPDSLTCYIGLGKHKLFSYQVVSIIPEPNVIRIVHTSRKCPENILFISKQRSSLLMRKINELGFRPSGDSKKIPERKGSAISWKTPLFFFAIQVYPILMFIINKYSSIHIINIDTDNIAWFYCLGMFIQFLLCTTTRLFIPLQILFLTKGRIFDEVSDYFNRTALVSISLFLLILTAKLNTDYSMFIIIVIIILVSIFSNFTHRLRPLFFDGLSVLE